MPPPASPAAGQRSDEVQRFQRVEQRPGTVERRLAHEQALEAQARRRGPSGPSWA
jgi:hypothetical protein